ncbi:hypothetical protein D3C71_2071670 [compost metagenome]
MECARRSGVLVLAAANPHSLAISRSASSAVRAGRVSRGVLLGIINGIFEKLYENPLNLPC